MRKKSHISLAKYLVDNLRVQDLHDHKKAFYIGSILPDLKPSFLTKRHTIEETFEVLVDEIRKLTLDYDIDKGINRYYARHLGVITHYLADYCTYPHNSIYPGTITDHVYYEKDLKFSLKEYVKREDTGRKREIKQIHLTFEDIIELITRTHNEYLKAIKAVKEDIRYIIELCFKVADAILLFFEAAFHNCRKTTSDNNIEVEYGQA